MSRIQSVTVAILSWNGRQHLEVCLAALRDQRDPGVAWDVTVLDNGSHDGTAQWLRANHPEVNLVESKVNLGFCGGMNRLIEASPSDAVALLNNDTRPRESWLAALVDAFQAAPSDVAAVSGKIVDWTGTRLDFGRGVMTFDGHAFQHDYRRPLARADVPADGAELLFACGGNMLIRRQDFLEAGGFDDDYFAYLEDVDLGWRLWARGKRVLFAVDAVVHHRSMATSDLLGGHNRGFLFERNAFLTAYKNYEPGLFEKVMPAVWLTWNHRAQTLLVQNNPRGEQLTFDPYAGHIANTAAPPSVDATPADRPDAQPVDSFETSEPPTAPEPPAPSPDVTASDEEGTLRAKWRAYGPREFARRGVRKALRAVLPDWVVDPLPDHAPVLVDGRTIAQFRAMTYLLGHLDAAAAKREKVQAVRTRSDLEIFERFPVAIVPTYPGDERLFASAGFAHALPPDLPCVHRRLDEIMALDDD